MTIVNIEDARLARAARDEAIEKLELSQGDWLRKAKQIAFDLCIVIGSFTVDDVRRICPPPKDCDPRIMGALVRDKRFEPLDFVNSRRVTSHYRAIRRFCLSQYGENLVSLQKVKHESDQ